MDTRPCLKDIYKWPAACSCLLLMCCSDFKICYIYYFRWVFVKISIPGITQCSKVFQSSHVNWINLHCENKPKDCVQAEHLSPLWVILSVSNLPSFKLTYHYSPPQNKHCWQLTRFLVVKTNVNKIFYRIYLWTLILGP